MTVHEPAIMNSHEEEMDLTLECVAKIRQHLTRLINNEGKMKYVNNLVVLNSMFITYDEMHQGALSI